MPHMLIACFALCSIIELCVCDTKNELFIPEKSSITPKLIHDIYPFFLSKCTNGKLGLACRLSKSFPQINGVVNMSALLP